MAYLVLHALSRAPRKLRLSRSPIVLGRDPACDFELPGPTVSRHQARLEEGSDGRWTLTPLSDTNPLVLNGRFAAGTVPLAEGDEVGIGAEYLLLFAESRAQADRYLGALTLYLHHVCQGCGWQGMVSTVRSGAACPRCGARQLQAPRAGEGGDAAGSASSTQQLDPAVVAAMTERLRTAKRSRLERIDDHPGPKRQDLSEGEATVIGTGNDATFRLHGISIGTGAIAIRWTGTAYQVESDLFFPKLKVNGRAENPAPLVDGDVVEIGSNRFRFVTE